MSASDAPLTQGLLSPLVSEHKGADALCMTRELLIEAMLQSPTVGGWALLENVVFHGDPKPATRVDFVALQADELHGYCLLTSEAEGEFIRKHVDALSAAFDSVQVVTTPGFVEQALRYAPVTRGWGVLVLPEADAEVSAWSVARVVGLESTRDVGSSLQLLSWEEARSLLEVNGWGSALPFALHEELWARLLECAPAAQLRRLLNQALRAHPNVVALRHPVDAEFVLEVV